MGWPFSPYTTHSANSVPKVTADELNEILNLQNGLAWAEYHRRPEVRLNSTDGATVDVVLSPLLILDAALSQHTYCAFPALSVSTANLSPPAGGWPANSWVYLYAYSTNRVGAIEASTTPPAVILPAVGVSAEFKAFKAGDETQKYIGCFYTSAVGTIKRFRMQNFSYHYLDEQIAANIDVHVSPAWLAGFQPIDCSQFVSPNASRAFFRSWLGANNTGLATLQLSVDGVSTGTNCGISDGLFLNAVESGCCELPLEGSTLFGLVTGFPIAFWLFLTDWAE
jgi:hypothetical protein